MWAGGKGSACFSLVVKPTGPSDVLEKALAKLNLEESEDCHHSRGTFIIWPKSTFFSLRINFLYLLYFHLEFYFKSFTVMKIGPDLNKEVIAYSRLNFQRPYREDSVTCYTFESLYLPTHDAICLLAI